MRCGCVVCVFLFLMPRRPPRSPRAPYATFSRSYGAKLRFMQSSGGLTEAERFRGPNALLSGPAGGVVGARQVARDAGHFRVIGFDMGGTSTDVSLSSGQGLDRGFESEVCGDRKSTRLNSSHVVISDAALCLKTKKIHD